MISREFELTSLGNHEVAAGGGYELSSGAPKPFALTLDIARAQFAQSHVPGQQDDAMNLLSITLGVQKPF